MKLQARLGHPVLIFIYTLAILLVGCAIGAHWKRLSGNALWLVVGGAILMVIHDMATGIVWFWITAKLTQSVYDRRTSSK